MSGGGGFRGRGFGPHGHHRQGLGPDLSGGPGSRSGGPVGSRLDGSGLRPPGPNLRSDGSNARLGNLGFNARGEGFPRGPCPNFNLARRPPRHPVRPSDNWAPRGGSPHFPSWRGGCPPRFNGPPRPFYRGRGQGPYMPRFPYMPTGNYPPPYVQFPPIPEPKPVEQKPTIPHLGSEEERQQKITEAADALKRKLSVVTKEPDGWREDDDEGHTECSYDADHDSRITNKGIPELKHDPPELNLTLGDLRDIGRVDHDHRTDERNGPKTNSEIQENFTYDESEVEILAHNPVKPMIEIDLWSDDNYGEYGKDEHENRTMEMTVASNEIQDTSQNTQPDAYPALYNFQSFNDNCTSYADDIELNDYIQEPQNKNHVETVAEQKTPPVETVIEQQNETVTECNAQELNLGQQIEVTCSNECENVQKDTVNYSCIDRTDVERVDITIVQQDELRIDNDSDSGKFHEETSQVEYLPEEPRVTTIEAPEKTVSENRDDETGEVQDNFDKSNVNETTEFEVVSRGAEDENTIERLGEGWLVLSSTTQDDATRIPGLDSPYTNETIEESSGETETRNDNRSEIINKVETVIVKSNIEENNINDLRSEVETAIVEGKIKEMRKDLKSENFDKKMSFQRTEFCIKSENRVRNESKSRKDDTSRETRYGTSKANRDKKQDRASLAFDDKLTNESKSDAMTTKRDNAKLRERRNSTELKIRNNTVGEALKERKKEKNREKSRASDNQNKMEKGELASSQSEKRTKRESCKKKTDSRDRTKTETKIDNPREKSESKIDKSTEVSSLAVKKIDDRKTAKEEESLTNLKFHERRKLVRMKPEGSLGTGNQSKTAIASKVPMDFESRDPPPMPVAKNFGISTVTKRQNQESPAKVVVNQDIDETHQIPPAFDPRLSTLDRTVLLATNPMSSSIPVNQDFGIMQSYPSRQITNFSPIVPAINYIPPPIITGTTIEPPTNIQPICLNDPYTPLLSLPNVPVTNINADPLLLLPPLPIEPPPLPSSPFKSSLDMDDGLEDMQEAMKFAKQIMNMDEPRGIADEANSADSDFFHMPTFPDLPPIELPPSLPDDTPRKPTDDKVLVNNREKVCKKTKNSKDVSVSSGPWSVPAEYRKNVNSSNEPVEEVLNFTDEQMRPKVMFNLSSKTKKINKDSEWQQQQHREEAAEAAAAAMRTIPISEMEKHRKNKSPLSPAVTPTLKEISRVTNGHEDRKKLRIVAEKCNAKASISNGNNSQIKKPEDSHSRSRSPSPAKTKSLKKHVRSEDPPTVVSERSEISLRKVTKESNSKKSMDESPESSWKSRVIGRFLKMSKNDICNMLNNTSLRKFDIAMKHLVKERRSSLSFGMRNNEEEKLKDTEVSYNREEFMDQLSAMLDPSATVDVCNLPTQFIHHLSEVLQLDSMSEFEAALTPSEHVEATASSASPQQVSRQTPRLSKERSAANTREIDDRRLSKREREKKSINAVSAIDTSVAKSPPTTVEETRKVSRPCEESIESKCAIKGVKIVEESQKNPATVVHRVRRRQQQRSALADQPEASTAIINGSAYQDNPSSLNMADVDDIFSAGIARAKKKVIQATRNEKNSGDCENEMNLGCKEAERNSSSAKYSSVDRVERTAVELDKIFAAGIARAKLASMKAAAKVAEANDGEDKEDDAAWKEADGRKSNLDDNSARHRPISRHMTKCEKWSRRKAREGPDAFRNLTKEEWEAKYGETSDSTYEREYRAMIAVRTRKSTRSPPSIREDRESLEGKKTSGIMSRLGNIVTGDSSLNEAIRDSDEDRYLRNINDSTDYPMGMHNRSSEDGSSLSSTTSTSSESSEGECEDAPSVTKLLKVIKEREKIGKKKSVNEEIRDEVAAEIERKRRERGRGCRKGHKSRTKKSHRRKKDRKVKEKKKREKKRKKRRTRRSGSDERESSCSNYTDEERTSSGFKGHRHRQLLTEEEIKREEDVVIIVKDEPMNTSEQSTIAKRRSESALTIRMIDDSRPTSTSSASSMPPIFGVTTATLSPSGCQTKTKAQLKQLPGLPKKIAAVVEYSKETSKKQEITINENPKENENKNATCLNSEASLVVTNPLVQNHPSASTSDDISPSSKTNSKKLDLNTYKERTRLRLLRENEKFRFIHENPSSLTQNLLNIPLTRKKINEKTESIVQHVEQPKNSRSATNEETSCTAISNVTISDANNRTGTNTTAANTPTISTTSANTSTISTASDKTTKISSTVAKIPTINITDAKSKGISATTSKIPTINNTSAKTATINTTITKTTTIEPSRVSVSESTVAQQPSIAKLPAKKLIRRKSVTKKVDTESTLTEARADAGKFAHIKSEGSKELKLREKLKKGRQRISSEGLETTIPLIQQPRVKKHVPNIQIVKNPEETGLHTVKEKINEASENKHMKYFKKGVASDGLPDIVPKELLPIVREESTKINELTCLPITELSSWPIDRSISTSAVEGIDSGDSPPFKGFADEAILRQDRVLTEAEINSVIDALETNPLGFEASPDALPLSTDVDLNDLRSTELPLDKPITYGDEEFVEGRDEIETSLLGFSVTNDIPDEIEAIGPLGDDEVITQNVEKLPEESHESLDILPRVTSTLSESPAPADFLLADVQRSESIPSPLLVTESVQDDNGESAVTDLSINNIEEEKKTINTNCDDATEVTSSHEMHNNATGTVYLEANALDTETNSSRITSAGGDKEILFKTQTPKVLDENKAECESMAQEMQEKRVINEDTSAKDNPSRNSTLESVHTPPPQPSSSSDSTEERDKEIAMEKQRDTTETHDSEMKSKESSHHGHSKSREHSHGKTKRKSSRHHNHGPKSNKKITITEKMVEEAVTANIVKLVPKPTSKETVMARMIEIDVEIHKLMNEKMTLYKMLESGELATKEDSGEVSNVKANDRTRTTSETEKNKEIVPPRVLASRLARDLDKAVLPVTAVTHNENPKKLDERKDEAEDVGRKSKRKKSPQRERKNREKEKESGEGRRQRKISESKSHTRRTTSEESSRHETISTHSREKSTSSTDLDETVERNHKRKSKSLQRQSPNRQSSKRSHEHSSKEDLGDGSRESMDRSVKSTKQEIQNLLEESPKSRLKKKTKNLDWKKSEEVAKAEKEEKRTSIESKGTEKSETNDKKAIGDGERGIIYSDESTWDSLEPEAIQSDEQRVKKDGGTGTGLALLEESFKREMAETRKIKAMEKRKSKKQELRRVLLGATTLPTGEEEIQSNDLCDRKRDQKNESVMVTRTKEKSANTNEVPGKIWKHVTTVIDAVAENRIEQLYNDETCSEPSDTVAESSSINDTAAEDKLEKNLNEMMEEATKTTEPDKDEPEEPEQLGKADDSEETMDSKDSVTVSKPIEDKRTEVEETTEVADAEDREATPDATKTISGNEDLQKIQEDNIFSKEITGKTSDIDILIERSTEKREIEITEEENAKHTLVDDYNEGENTIKTLVNILTNEEKEKEEIEENQLSTTLDNSELIENQEEEINDEKTEDSQFPSPDVPITEPKLTEKLKEKHENKEQSKNEISMKEAIQESTDSSEKALESNKEKRDSTDPEIGRNRSKIRNKRSEKQRHVALRDILPRVKRLSDTETKHISSKAEESNKHHAKKTNSRPRSATKRKQCEKSVTPNRRSSRYSEDSGKSSRIKKREKSNSRGTSPHDGEPTRKKMNHSRVSSSPILQATLNEDQTRRRGRKRKRRPEISQDEMMSCKVVLIDCKYTYLSPSMHPKVLKKLGISKINPYTAPTLVADSETASKHSRVDTASLPILRKIQVSKETEELPPSPNEAASSSMASHPSPKVFPSSPIESPSSPKQLATSSNEIGNRVEVDEDDDEDDAFDETIQIVKVADENLPLTSQSEDEEMDDLMDITEDTVAPPDSTADDIAVDDENNDKNHDENIREADTTDEIELLEEKVKNVDKSTKIQEVSESEAEDEDLEPRRTRYTVHKGPILDIKVLDDSFLAASEDGAIYRYSQTSNGILNIYKGHEAAVTCIYVLEMAGKCWKLYSGSLDGTFRCYDITTGVQERLPADVGSPVQCMDQAWGVIFVGTKSGHISRYNIKSGSIKGDRLEFSDKSVLALKASSEGPRRILIVASRNQPITIRDALTGLFLRTICGYKNHTVYSLMRERNLVYCGTSSTSIPVFDFTNGEQITQYNAGVGIVCMRLYRQILFAGCYDGNIYVFDTKETKLICSIPGPGNMLLSMEIVNDEIIAGSKNRQLHSWRMPRQVRALLSERT